jgi:hypothetical protein
VSSFPAADSKPACSKLWAGTASEHTYAPCRGTGMTGCCCGALDMRPMQGVAPAAAAVTATTWYEHTRRETSWHRSHP